MGYIKETLNRMNLQEIRSFVLNGAGDLGGSESYEEIINENCKAISERLRRIYTDAEEFEAAYGELSQALNAYEIVYMELGMRAGARLILQLVWDEGAWKDSSLRSE